MKFFQVFVTILFFFLQTNVVFATENDCSRGAAFTSFQCYSKELKAFELEMDKALESAAASVKTHWGTEADQELKKRMAETQVSWKKYRDGHCEKDYYTKASVHPPSLSMEIAACKVKKTKERIKEIKKSFLNP
jgi:uncharacterized protein YecT (DUF1311 family)